MGKLDDIDLAEWLGALEASEKSSEGLTTREIAELLGISMQTAHERIRQAIAKKLLRCAGRRRVMGIDGIERPIPAYTTVTPDAEEGR